MMYFVSISVCEEARSEKTERGKILKGDASAVLVMNLKDECDVGWLRSTPVLNKCKLPNMTLSLNLNRNLSTAARDRRSSVKRNFVSHFPLTWFPRPSDEWFPTTKTTQPPPEMAEVKGNQTDLCQHKYNFGICQHARLAFWWHWNITRAEA